MADRTAPHGDGHPGHVEGYAHGYDSALTLKWHASRTADKQAGWFLGYLQPGMTLLDCGCGSGSITVGLAKVVDPGLVTGVDSSEVEIERARARVAGADIANIRFVVGNIYRLDFPDDSYDALFSHNVLEHVGQPQEALREMRRVLKPGGVIGIRDVDVGGHLLAPAGSLLDRFMALHEADWEATNGHPRLGRRLGGLLAEAGFADVVASASYEVYGDLQGRRFISQMGASRVTEGDFVRRVTERGLASVDELEALKEAWLAWPELPEAFFALSHGEAVARKA